MLLPVGFVFVSQFGWFRFNLLGLVCLFVFVLFYDTATLVFGVCLDFGCFVELHVLSGVCFRLLVLGGCSCVSNCV